MICISSPAGVRMAKAGKALEAANNTWMRAHPYERSPHKEEVRDARREWHEAVLAVADELYRQNLHEMTEK